MVLQKLERNQKEIHLLETLNLLRSLSNIFDLNKLFLIICEFSEIRFHNTIAFLIDNIEKSQNHEIIKKLQNLVTNE